MTPGVSCAAGAAVLLFAVVAQGAAAAERRPFTVDVMVKTEGLAEALFTPDGEHLLLETTGAYDTSPNFAWERLWSRDRATLLRVDLGEGAARPVAPDPKEHLWIGSYSPSGRQAAVGWFDGVQAKLGVYDFRTATLRKLDVLISNLSLNTCAFDCPYWLSEDRFVHYTLSAGQQAKQMSDVAYTHGAIERGAHDSWEGKVPAVKVLGSGVHQSPAVEEGGRVIEVDARSGAVRTLDEGYFWEMSLAPDRQHLALLRETGPVDLSHTASVVGVFAADRVLALEVYDFGRGRLVHPCESCNVTQHSLRWSPSGRRLLFGARVSRDGKVVHEQYVYDFARSTLARFDARGLDVAVSADLHFSTYVTPIAWLDDDTFAVRVSRGTDKPEVRGAPPQLRHDWYALRARGKPVLLTGGLEPKKDEKPLADFVAVHDGKLLMLADGEIWSLAANGRRENLTRDIAEELSPWCSVIAYWRDARLPPVCGGLRVEFYLRSIDEQALAAQWLTFRVMKDGQWSGDLLFFNLRTREAVRLARPDGDGELVTASATARAAVYRRKADDGDRVTLARANGSPAELLHINRQLEGVVGGQPVMLTRREPGDGEDRIDWLLLPPDHRPGDRHPLLVYFYPDTKYTKDWRSDDLRDVSYLNQHIPAAHGFAVLLASMKISTMEQRGDPMLEMHEQLVHAAENAVKEGYADPERWALMGHSYGGYGTNAVITQTNRFRAAIAMSGPANLTSSYAIGIQSARATAVAASMAFGVLWNEGGQGRMGVPPWQDPERYVRNSPIFRAGQIRTPLLLIHGDDDFVNIGEAEQMFNALQRQGKDAMLLRYWGEGHNFQSPANMRDMWNRIYDWLDRYLDIARDAAGNVVLEDHRVKSRGAAAAPAR